MPERVPQPEFTSGEELPPEEVARNLLMRGVYPWDHVKFDSGGEIVPGEYGRYCSGGLIVEKEFYEVIKFYRYYPGGSFFQTEQAYTRHLIPLPREAWFVLGFTPDGGKIFLIALRGEPHTVIHDFDPEKGRIITRTDMIRGTSRLGDYSLSEDEVGRILNVIAKPGVSATLKHP